MIVRVNNKGSVPVELIKQNKLTAIVRIENKKVTTDNKGVETVTITYKNIKRKLKDIVSA